MARPKQHRSPRLRPLSSLPPRAWAMGLLATLGACGSHAQLR